MKKVAIIDYQIGNVDSVVRAVQECGGQPSVSSEAAIIEDASFIVLPGVGSFAQGMKSIRAKGLDEILHEQAVVKGIPFLGVCLGMQLMGSVGFEGGETQGLGWIDGDVELLARTCGERLPHIGWNEVMPKANSDLFAGIESGRDFYFVHSYHLSCRREDQVLARTPYCGSFVSAVQRNNLFGVQFHPEKSQRLGFEILTNFLKL